MIFDPFKIKKITLPNRIVRSATAERIAMRDEREGLLLGEKYAALLLKQCDAVSMSRPLICQPNLPSILREGGSSRCRGCNLCLLKRDGPTVCHARGAASRPLNN